MLASSLRFLGWLQFVIVCVGILYVVILQAQEVNGYDPSLILVGGCIAGLLTSLTIALTLTAVAQLLDRLEGGPDA